MQSIHIRMNDIGMGKMLDSNLYVQDIFFKILEKSQVNVRGTEYLPFYPNGATMLVILAESHASMHTWPEEDEMQLDFFCCGDINKIDDFRNSVLSILNWTYGIYITIDRTTMNVVNMGEFKNGIVLKSDKEVRVNV